MMSVWTCKGCECIGQIQVPHKIFLLVVVVVVITITAFIIIIIIILPSNVKNKMF